MSMIASIKVPCGGDVHTISVYEPEDEWSCMPESVIMGPMGHYICLENHNYDSEKVLIGLGGKGMTIPECFKWVSQEHAGFMLREVLFGRDYQEHDLEDQAIVMMCAYEDLDHIIESRAIEESSIRCRLNLVKFLIGLDIDVTEKGRTRRSPLQLAAMNNCVDIVKLMIEQPEVGIHELTDALYWAVSKENESVTRFLLTTDADIDESDALSAACENDNKELVKLLVESGADITHGKGSAIVTSVVYGCEEILEYLLSHKPDVSKIDLDTMWEYINEAIEKLRGERYESELKRTVKLMESYLQKRGHYNPSPNHVRMLYPESDVEDDDEWNYDLDQQDD